MHVLVMEFCLDHLKLVLTLDNKDKAITMQNARDHIFEFMEKRGEKMKAVITTDKSKNELTITPVDTLAPVQVFKYLLPSFKPTSVETVFYREFSEEETAKFAEQNKRYQKFGIAI